MEAKTASGLLTLSVCVRVCGMCIHTHKRQVQAEVEREKDRWRETERVSEQTQAGVLGADDLGRARGMD